MGERKLAAEILRLAVEDAKKGIFGALDFFDPRNKMFIYWAKEVLGLDTKAFLFKLATELQPEVDGA